MNAQQILELMINELTEEQRLRVLREFCEVCGKKMADDNPYMCPDPHCGHDRFERIKMQSDTRAKYAIT